MAFKFTVQNITTFDPTTQKLSQRWGVKRADTLRAIEEMSGRAERDEFYEKVVKADPERIAPWTSSTGFTVVVFQPRIDPRNSWEPVEKAEAAPKGGGYRCTECGKITKNRGAMALHQKAGHTGVEIVEA